MKKKKKKWLASFLYDPDMIDGLSSEELENLEKFANTFTEISKRYVTGIAPLTPLGEITKKMEKL